MKAQVIQFRRGRHTIHERHFLLDVQAKNKEEASSFIGKIVEWKSSSGKSIKGRISSSHGNKGLVRAIFERGLPGQALNQEVEVSTLASENKNEKSSSRSANKEEK